VNGRAGAGQASAVLVVYTAIKYLAILRPFSKLI
jgi:hypothetical protein